MTKINSEKRLCKEIGIKDFKHMTSEKVNCFIGMIPELIPRMNPELVKAALNHFPEYSQIAMAFFNGCRDIINEELSSESSNYQEFVGFMKYVIAQDYERLKEENLTEEEKKEITENIFQLVQMVKDELDESRKCKWKVVGTIFTFGFGTLGIIAGALANAFGGGETSYLEDNDESDDNDDDNVA